MNKRNTLLAALCLVLVLVVAYADEVVSKTINYQNSTLTFDANTVIKDADGNWTIDWSRFQFLSTNTGGGGSATVSWPSTVTNLFQSVGVVRNVTAYGAKGDSSTDDTASLIAAFAAATNGDTVFFPPGTYMLTTNSIYVEGKTIAIAGVPGQSIIKNRSATAIADRGITIRSQIATAGGSYSLLTESIYEGKNSTNIVKLADSSIFTAGEYVWLYDASRTTNWNATDAINREIVKVETVYDANTIDIDRVPVGTYKVGFSGRLAKMLNGATRVSVYGLTLDGFGFDLQGLHSSTFEKCEVRNSVSQYQFGASHCSNLRLIECAAVSAPNKTPPSTSYGFAINTCVNTFIDRFRAVGVAECNVSYRSFGTTIQNSIFDKTQDLNLHGVGERKSIIQNCFFKNSYLLLNAGSEIGCYDSIIQGNIFEGSFGSVGKISCGTVTAVSPTFTSFGLTYKSNGGIKHGMPVMFSGTVPNEITTYKTYYLAGASATNVCVTASKPRPPLAVTFDGSTNNWTVSTGSGFAHKDVCVFDGGTLPSGLTAGRPYYFAQKSSGVYYLSPAQDLANPTWGVSTNTVTLTAGFFSPSDRIVFQGSGTPPTGINKQQPYYLKAVAGAAANVFNISDTDGGATVTMSGSPSGSFYTCYWFGTDAAGTTFAEIGTPITSMTGTLGSVSMYPVGADILIANNKISDVQAEGIQISRFVNVQCVGNSIGPEGPYKWSTPIGFNFAACDNVDVKGNTVIFKGPSGTSAYGGKMDLCRNIRWTGNTFDTPSANTLFQGPSSSTLSQLVFADNVYVNHATRALALSTNLITGIRTGGMSVGNFYGGSGVYEGRGTTVSSASIATASPGTVGSTIIALADLTGTCNIDIDDGYWFPNDQLTVIRRGAGAFDLVVRKKSDASTLFSIPNGWYGYAQFFNEAVTNGIVKGITYTNNVALP